LAAAGSAIRSLYMFPTSVQLGRFQLLVMKSNESHVMVLVSCFVILNMLLLLLLLLLLVSGDKTACFIQVTHSAAT
jgi:hypothetical protein